MCKAHLPTHQKMKQHYSTHTKVSEHTCKICQKAFTTKSGYNNHMTLHGTYKCFLTHTCQHRFPSRHSLKDHLMQDSMYSQLDQYCICDFCLKNFSTRDTMLKHRKRRCIHNPNIKLDYVTGPPGALLFDRDQRSHWKNHFNCSSVQLATWAFIAQISFHRC